MCLANTFLNRQEKNTSSTFSHRCWLRSGRLFNQLAHSVFAGCCRKSFQTPECDFIVPTHTYRQRPCQTPDYPTSPCRCSSQCHVHTSSGIPGRLQSKKVKVSTSGLLYKCERSENVGILANLHGGEACCERTGWRWTATRRFPLCFRQQSKVSVSQTDMQD